MKRERATRTDAGFTVIELLITIVIEALIVGALGSAFVLVVNNTGKVSESLSRTNDARFAASYIVSDARNSSGAELSLSDTASCPDGSPPVAGTPNAVVRFNWNSTNSSGAATANIVNYVRVSNSLLRRFCQNGSLVNDRVLASNVSSVAIVCAPTADCSGTPTSLTATITETQGTSTAAAYQYSLTGAFRKALAVGAVLPGPVNPITLVAMGSGGSCSSGGTGVSLTSSSNLRVYGDAYINTTNAACKALSMTNSSVFQAGSTKILTGGSCAATTGSVCPPSTSYSPAIADPYGNVTAPTTTGLLSKSGCPSGNAAPGVYSSALAITASCVMATGTYYLQNGLSVSNGATLSSAAGGVTIFISTGTVTTSGGGAITVTAKSTGSWAGIAIWQAAADTTTMAFGSTGNIDINGFVYAVGAQVSITNTSANPSMDGLIAKVIWMTSSGKISVGKPSSTPLTITGPAAPPSSWTINRPYPTQTLTAAGGDGNYIWDVTNLPTGMAFDAQTGVVDGTPTATGTFNAGVTLDDLLGDDQFAGGYTIVINAAPSITTSSPLPGGEVTAAYSTTLAKSGGTSPYTWSATGLPAGLSINSGTGVISGTPTAAGTTSASVTLTDGAGATVNKSLSTTIVAAPVISSVTLQNGGSIQGRLDKGDKIIVVYSAQMDVSDFCSAWTTDTSNQLINADSNVSVAVTNGTSGANDSISVTSTSCTFNFGTINLGSTAYVTSNSSFGGTSTNVSSIAWTTSTHTLTITLGALASGAVATVTSSAPTYTASGSLSDTGGGTLTNSPFTLSNVKQF